jgi:type I restriction enzyme, S subunit
MTLETFFEKFDQFADAPDAVAKMRELMLQLAVQGKLVEGRENDGNAAKIFTDGRPPEAPSRYEVAENWIWIRFAAVGEQRLGKMLDQKGNRGDLKPYLRNTNVQWMRFQLDDIKELRLESEELEEFRLVPGDLLICEGGEPGRCAIWRDPDREMYFQKAIHRVRPRKGILSEYLAICLQVDAQNGVLAKHFTGATIKHFTGRSLSEYTIPLPPLAEQKRIVAKVDELMALCDRLETQQQERETRHAALARASLARFADAPTPANLPFLFHPSYAIPPADLRKSILTLAVQGKLVPKAPNDEPAEEIVSRIETERPEETEAPVDEAELPWSLPSCWQWVRLGTIANIKHGYAFSSESFTSEPTRYVLTTPGSFYESGGFRDRGANTKYFKGEVPPAFVLKARDLIIPMTEQAAGLLGSPAFIPDDGKTYLHNQRLGKMEFYSDEVSPEFVFCFFNSEFFRGELARTCTGMKVRHTSPKRVLKVPFPLPPLAEQRRIVAKVEQLMALVDALETQLAASRATAANLLSALVAELTGTPNDGKVSVPSTATTGRRGRPRKSP